MSEDQDVQDYLDTLPDQLKEQLSGVIREQAELLSEAQKAALRALEEPPEETGHLEASCVVVSGSSDLEVLVQAGGEATTVGNYDHALAFEFGTSHQPARPFFYPTYNSMKDDMQQAIDDAASEVLQ